MEESRGFPHYRIVADVPPEVLTPPGERVIQAMPVARHGRVGLKL